MQDFDSDDSGQMDQTGCEDGNTRLSAAHNSDEFDSDYMDSDEDTRNTIGNVPRKWYDTHPHIGYDWDSERIMKPNKSDEVELFMRKMDGTDDFWRTVEDQDTGQEVMLSSENLETVQNLTDNRVPDTGYDLYAPWVEWFTSDVLQMPLRAFPEHKRSFLPSKIEKMKVSKMVHNMKQAIRLGIKQKPKAKDEEGPGKAFYMMWDDMKDDINEQVMKSNFTKLRLPHHAESYNPPKEYLFTEKELNEWQKFVDEPWKRKYNFVPKLCRSLREVDAYSNYTRERFERCMDLYMCPRGIKLKLKIDTEDLIPKLPSPRDLQPFPTVESITYVGHSDMVRTLSVEPAGQFICTGSDDGTLKIWELSTGRCFKSIDLNAGVIKFVIWCPNKQLSLIAAAVEKRVFLLNPLVGSRSIYEQTDSLLAAAVNSNEAGQNASDGSQKESNALENGVKWNVVKSDEDNWNLGVRLVIDHFKEVSRIDWHAKGDYLLAVLPDGLSRSVIIHQLSKRKSQIPFRRLKGLVQCAMFHPIKPFLFVASQRHIRIYDLLKQQLMKKLMSGSKWISSIAIHPGGDNILVGTYDKKLLWFDLDLSCFAYQKMIHHQTAIRSVDYHKQYPLFASCSDDGYIFIYHGMIYNDLTRNALIVPLKKLTCQARPKGVAKLKRNDLGIIDVKFHSCQPWILSSGSDHTARLFT